MEESAKSIIMFYLIIMFYFCANFIYAKDQLDVPVLLIIFNRPEIQQHAFNKIREVKPAQLFIAADGPREKVLADREKCARARKIIEQVDWHCEVKTFYRDKNLGCDAAVSTAVSWFFDQVEHGIILEDDCVPSESFFYFCQLMLERYKDDERIWNILGSNYYGKEKTYFFSTVFLPTGWASWRRAWKHFDPFALRHIDVRKLKNPLQGKNCLRRWNRVVKGMKRNVYLERLRAWDYIWMIIAMVNQKLSVCPPVNMIDHSLGHGDDATHFKEINSADLRTYLKAYDADVTTLTSQALVEAKYVCMPDFFDKTIVH